MKRRYDDGGEILEAANVSEESMDIADSMGAGPKNTDIPKAKAKAAPKTKPKPKAERRGLDEPSKYGMREEDYFKPATDKTKMSVSERAKANRESARSGSSTTDKRSVNERLKSAFGMKSGGSASSRADGIATKGKTRGKMY
jgi:hypothetical protein